MNQGVHMGRAMVRHKSQENHDDLVNILTVARSLKLLVSTLVMVQVSQLT
jgi:hypothetical protein